MENVVKNIEEVADSNAMVGSSILKNGSRLLAMKRLTGGRQKKRLVFGACATVFVAMASVLIFYGCRKFSDNPLMMSTHSDMRYFETVNDLFDEVNRLSDMDDEELAAYENSIGFQSFGRKSETIYWQILHELGEPFGVEYFGDEEMSDVEVNFTVDDAQVYVSQYPEYLKIETTVAENGETEYEFVPKYNNSPYRYIMNENGMFQVGDNIFKVFEYAVLYTSIDKADMLSNITETNIKNVVLDIFEKEAAGEEPLIKCSGSKTGSQQKDDYIWAFGPRSGYADDNKGYEVDNKSTPGTPGCSNKSKGTLERYQILTISQPASNNKERVRGNFNCESYDSGPGYWDCNAYYSVYAQWRGCNSCVWIGCKRTLHSDICMEIWHVEVVYSKTDAYNSSKPVKQSGWRDLFRERVAIQYQSDGTKIKVCRSSIYNLTGKYWIATTSRTLNF